MAQVFHRSANTIARASIIGVVLAVSVLLWAALEMQRSPYATYQEVAQAQPVPFSHQHHVSGDGIDCRYCHTSVENSSYAGIPPTKTCMNCHSLMWTKVNYLPDFVYFDHSIHINKGVGCASCHGPVNKMPLMYEANSLQMEWCLNCHRAPEKFLRPRDQVFNMLYEQPSSDNPVKLADGSVFTGQIALGTELKHRYNVRSVEGITSCNTCHR